MNDELIKYCARCKIAFECRADYIRQCHCYTVQLTEQQVKDIALKYSGCLCNDCLHLAEDNAI